MRNEHLEVNYIDLEEAYLDDWRVPIIKFLMNPSTNVNKKIQLVAPHYILMDGELYKKSKEDGLLLRCLDKLESIQVMGEVHNGLCGAHQAETKMRWLLKRYGYHWRGILKDCNDFTKSCQACQKYGPIQRVPTINMQLMVKSWPFRG
ncbi:uncharacterized protein LOC132296517 [Cornus florida]|uniref:uncharacterized protein LOC132296517 n=1 Tax=Cornus florida TaxID=4283 RepID=UPI0028A01A47|nr:uncharacterized protein LOC132296517 [Cornus florida]